MVYTNAIGKSEIRISKFETNSNIECTNDKNRYIRTDILMFGSFEFLSLDIVSDFEFRT